MNSAVGEEVAVDKCGFLNIPWPGSKDRSDLGLNALLATTTNPTIVGGHYPSPEKIADAWNTPDPEGKCHVDYFCENRKSRIKTFQDCEIEDRLKDLRQSNTQLIRLSYTATVQYRPFGCASLQARMFLLFRPSRER